jgi:hypothetical protein
MDGIFVFQNGNRVPAKVERMFKTHGAFLLNGVRLDTLSKLQILVDSSTSTRLESGQSISTSDTGSAVGRAIVGGVILGEAGAIIGGMTGKKTSAIDSVTTEVKNTQLTAELTFHDGSTMNVFLTSLDVYHWLLEMVGKPPMTDEELEIERKLSIEVEEEKAIFRRRWAQVDSEIKEPRNKDGMIAIFEIIICLIVAMVTTSIMTGMENSFSASDGVAYFIVTFLICIVLSVPIWNAIDPPYEKKMKAYEKARHAAYTELVMNDSLKRK